MATMIDRFVVKFEKSKKALSGKKNLCHLRQME
jgi:hypothetical protein